MLASSNMESPLLGKRRLESPVTSCQQFGGEDVTRVWATGEMENGQVSPSESLMTKQEVMEGFDVCENPHHLQSDSQTILNTINLYVGVGLLSTGYAIRLGGWSSMLVLGATTFVFSRTAKLLCYAFDALPPGIVPSYPNLGQVAFGTAGHWLVVGAVLLEFWGALGMCLIVLWQSLAMLLPATCLATICLQPSQVAVAVSTAVILPAIWIRSFSRLTSISLSGVSGSLLLIAVVVTAYLLDPHSADVASPAAREHQVVDLKHLPMAAGIFMVSLSGHAGLPSLRRAMAQPHHFDHCLDITFATMFALYATMGGFAYLYFGDSLQVLVTSSLNSSSSVSGAVVFTAGSISISVSQALTLFVALSVYSTIPPLVYVMAELLLDLIHISPVNGQHSGKVLEPLVRTGVIILGYSTAIIAYNVLSHVESIVGGFCSVIVSMILPAAIYYQLYSPSLGIGKRICLAGLILLGVAAAIGITALNVIELHQP